MQIMGATDEQYNSICFADLSCKLRNLTPPEYTFVETEQVIGFYLIAVLQFFFFNSTFSSFINSTKDNIFTKPTLQGTQKKETGD